MIFENAEGTPNYPLSANIYSFWENYLQTTYSDRKTRSQTWNKIKILLRSSKKFFPNSILPFYDDNQRIRNCGHLDFQFKLIFRFCCLQYNTVEFVESELTGANCAYLGDFNVHSLKYTSMVIPHLRMPRGTVNKFKQSKDLGSVHVQNQSKQ